MKRRERSNSILFVVFFPCVGSLLDGSLLDGSLLDGWMDKLILVFYVC